MKAIMLPNKLDILHNKIELKELVENISKTSKKDIKTNLTNII